MSHRDYWIVKLDDGFVLMVSRDSVSRKVLVSVVTTRLGQAVTEPVEADFDPDQLAVGVVMESASGKQATITKVTPIPHLTATGRTG